MHLSNFYLTLFTLVYKTLLAFLVPIKLCSEDCKELSGNTQRIVYKRGNLPRYSHIVHT